MSAGELDQRGYLVVAGPPTIRDPDVEACLEALRRQGWAVRLELEGLRILTAPRFPWPVAQIHRDHALIGEWRGEGAHPPAIAGRSPEGASLARGLIDEGWGAYLLIWRDGAGGLDLLRDPTGALHLVWGRGGARGRR